MTGTRRVVVKRGAFSPKTVPKKLKKKNTVDTVDDIEKEKESVDIANPLLELLSKNYGTTVEFTINDLASMFKSLSDTITILQTQNLELKDLNNTLSAKVCKLEGHIVTIQDSIKTMSAVSKSYAQVAGSSSTMVKTLASAVATTIAAPEAQLSIMKAAGYAQTSDSRKANVLIKNVDLTKEAIEEGDLADQIAAHCGTEKPTVFRLPLITKGPPIVKLSFRQKQEAEKVLGLFDSVKDKIQGCLNATPRPDLSKPELVKYRQSWKEAIQKNNEAKARLFTVRNLEVVKIQYKENQQPWPWTIKKNVSPSI
ncbi:hypothetical protein CAEBREN_13496 [Caenorhabditis brenneri]|uniref:Uncharacterized protein n=1 Tax=Caenorhabditis brenneri TaxID=135651 RepID=G0NIW3_CAEBE|nr:hypothetical protein CAEBREN_13496 [Caenorhabditis brenneri]